MPRIKIKRLDVPTHYKWLDFEDDCPAVTKEFTDRIILDSTFSMMGLQMLVDSLGDGWYRLQISKTPFHVCFVKRGRFCYSETNVDFKYTLEQLMAPVLRANEIAALKTLKKAGLTSKEQDSLLYVIHCRQMIRETVVGARKRLCLDND